MLKRLDLRCLLNWSALDLLSELRGSRLSHIIHNNTISLASSNLPSIPLAAFGILPAVGRMFDRFSGTVPVFLLQPFDKALELRHVDLAHVVGHFNGDSISTVAFDGTKELHLGDLSPSDIVVKQHLALALGHALAFIENIVVIGSHVLNLFLYMRTTLQIETITNDFLA